MKYLRLYVFVCFLIPSFISAQKKEISLQEIWNGTFKTEKLEKLHSMENGQQYSVLNIDKTNNTSQLDIYDFKTLKKVKTLVNSANLADVQNFSDYTFSKDERKVILATDVDSIYRRSRKGHYYVFNANNNTASLIYKEKIQEPTFSPDGTMVAFGYKNNLFIKDIQSDAIIQVTFDGEKNKIINGIADWVYEEEFKIVRAFEWNSESKKIAFIRFDETNVPLFSMDIYGTGLYPTDQTFKYPKAGENNSIVSLYVFDLTSKLTKEVKVNKTYKDFYIPRIKWTEHPNVLSAQFLNRHQNDLDLWFINTETFESQLILAEKDKAYVSVTDDLTFLKDNSFIWTSEKDGFRHIYHYDFEGELIDQVTKGNWDVTKYYGYDAETKKIFYQSVENGSINRDIYSIDLNGRNKKRLTKSEGTNKADFSSDYSYFINTFSNATTPPEYTLNSAVTGDVLKSIMDNDKLAQKLLDYKTSKKEFSTIHVNGNDLNMWMIKPADFDPNKQYPMLMFQYSGPGSQKVANTWNTDDDYWHQHLAEQGYIIVCVDGRGTGFKGSDFKKSTYLNLVKYETEDQIQAAKQLSELPYIDKDRIGIWGKSFGGHMATNCLLKGNDIFKMAIALAPVTSWRFYDSVYTERYLRTPQENPSGYDDNSPLNYPELLNGDYLLIHGSGDDNVHLQNTMRMAEALIQADKQFEWGIYPDKNHSIKGGNTRKHLFEKMTNFVNEKLGDKRDKQKSEKQAKIDIKG